MSLKDKAAFGRVYIDFGVLTWADGEIDIAPEYVYAHQNRCPIFVLRGNDVVLDVEAYISQFIGLLRQKYGARLLYVGLQGSYLRNEATESSDIDLMVVVDGLSVDDLDRYREAIISIGDCEKSCGFICGKTDLAHWNPLEICHLLHSTKDYYGTLEDLVPRYTQENIRDFVKISVNNLYHEICHRYLHSDWETNTAQLPCSYRSVFFILQNLYYLEHGVFVQTKAGLRTLLSGKDRSVLDTAVHLAQGEKYDFPVAFSLLFSWCQDTMKKL